MLAIMLFSTENMRNADSLFCSTCGSQKALNSFQGGKALLCFAVVVAVTTRILSNFKFSEKTSCKLSRAIVLLNATAVKHVHQGRILQRFKVFSAHLAISQAHTLITFN